MASETEYDPFHAQAAAAVPVHADERQAVAGPARGASQVFAITWLTYAGYYLCRKNLGVAIPLLSSQAGFDESALATIVFLYSLFYAVCQFALGPLSDRFGPRLLVGAGLSVVILSNLLMGFAGKPWHFMVLACLNGAAQATGWSALVKCMGTWFAPQRRGVVMSWWSTNYVFGGFLATTFATFLVTSSWILPSLAWRRAFLLPAIVLLGILALFLAGVRNLPNSAGGPKGSQSPLSSSTTERLSESLVLLRDPTVWIISVSYFFVQFTRYAFLFWLPFLLTQRFAYSTERAGYLSSLYDLAGVVGVVFAGYLADTLLRGRRFAANALLLAALSVLLMMHSFFAEAGVGGVGLWIALSGILTYGPDTMLSGVLAQDLGSGRLTGSVAGFIDGFGHLGSLISPFLVVMISKGLGWDGLFAVFAGSSAAAAALLLTRWRHASRC